MKGIAPAKDTFKIVNDLFNIDWTDKKVLDWGGSIGYLMTSSNGIIKPENYTCVDVAIDAVNVGKQKFPDSTWIHYNKFNPPYNSEGNVQEEFPVIVEHYDIAIAQSVYTHTSMEEWIEAHAFIKQVSDNQYYTYFDIHSKMKSFFYNKRVEKYDSCISLDIETDDYIYFVDNDMLTKEFPAIEKDHVLTLHNTEYLKGIFTDENCYLASR